MMLHSDTWLVYRRTSLCIMHMTRKKRVSKFAMKLPLAVSFCMSLAQQEKGLACKYINCNSISTYSHIYITCTYSKFSTKIYGYTKRYLKIPLQWKVKVKNFQHICNVNLWYSKIKNTEMYNHTPSLPQQHSECVTYSITVTVPYQN